MTNELPENDSQQAQVQMQQDIEIDRVPHIKDMIKVIERILADAEEKHTNVMGVCDQPRIILISKTYIHDDNRTTIDVEAAFNIKELHFVHYDEILKLIHKKWQDNLCDVLLYANSLICD